MPVAPQPQRYSVSEITALLASALRDLFPELGVTGEVSNFMRARSGHCYFSLKDDRAQIACVLFRSDAQRLAFQPADGDQVEVRARLDFYAGSGKLQLKCSSMVRAGDGELLAAFEALRKRLAAEGLFDERLKRPLPRMPRRIGIITSADAAALRDIQTTLARRWPLAELFLLPVPVQGKGAAERIAAALAALPRRAPVELILLARGGGSIEDLWSFNEEIVARAIRACPVPVISGVGHETDTTIADWAADLRAPTPTAAAEHATPDRGAVGAEIARARQRLATALAHRLQRAEAQLQQTQRLWRGRSPEYRVQHHLQRLDDTSLRLQRAGEHRLHSAAERLRGLRARLARVAPQRQLLLLDRRHAELRRRLHAALQRQLAPQRGRQRLADGRRRLATCVQQKLQQDQRQLQQLRARLAALGPEQTLQRGFAIVHTADGAILRRPDQVRSGDRLQLRLAGGRLAAIARRDTD